MIWIITKEYNEYDQFGEYFVAAFSAKPTFSQLKELITESDDIVGRLTRGGGRRDSEYHWYNLHEQKEGVSLHEFL